VINSGFSKYAEPLRINKIPDATSQSDNLSVLMKKVPEKCASDNRFPDSAACDSRYVSPLKENNSLLDCSSTNKRVGLELLQRKASCF